MAVTAGLGNTSYQLALKLPVRDGVVELIGLRDAVLLKLGPWRPGKITDLR